MIPRIVICDSDDAAVIIAALAGYCEDQLHRFQMGAGPLAISNLEKASAVMRFIYDQEMEKAAGVEKAHDDDAIREFLNNDNDQ